MTWPRILWQEWAVFGLVGAVAVELLQGLLLPDRSADFSDIVANGTGAVLGAVVGSWLMPAPDIDRPR
jgi:glycopeptide antibiotics resistance protein